MAALSVAALGVVYGDIGTSPLYALHEALAVEGHLHADARNVLGVLSLIFWSLILVISIKYLIFILRADNRGEGGILALTSLVAPVVRKLGRKVSFTILMAGLFGAALLYGDSMITPAISVLAAVEGLGVATPVFDPYVIPITIGILVGLFFFQRKGTEGVGRIFGPITLIWFLVIGTLGAAEIVRYPAVLAAVDPRHAADFFLRNGWAAFMALGGVFLVVTGGEALYADLGHFGRRPIRLTWFSIVLPGLLLNYFGQGALLLHRPEAIRAPFFLLAPSWALYPLVALATAATVIASQAVISGAYSLTRGAVQLGYLPRMQVEHTSEKHIGQIYMPGVNWLLMIACIGLVLGFRTSSNLAAAYGVAVTTTMVVTTILFGAAAQHRWGWSFWVAAPVAGFFLVVDLAFFGANLLKIPHGGWFPLLVAGLAVIAMTTWARGRDILAERIHAGVLPVTNLLEDLDRGGIPRVPGTAVFMYKNPAGVPPALLHNLKHNKVLHERVILLTVRTEEIPYVDEEDRATAEDLGRGLYRVVLRWGFAEDPDVPAGLRSLRLGDWDFRLSETSFFLGRENLLPTRKPGMAMWREHLFAFMSRNARGATSFFRIPPNRVVELGAQVEI
ncbi:MAG TPA: potassium transporter Kup [Gemmatimonadota bacterium]|nr:potassium transporter Kup [Gemmatimonadota bacterium]